MLRKNGMQTNVTGLIDTHFHLDLFPQPEAIVQQMEENGITAIAVTNTPSVFHYTYQLSQKYRSIMPAVGLHPELAVERRHELPTMRDWLNKTRFVGEVGLDYVSPDENNRKIQRLVFQDILATCAEYGDKVLTIHSRRASADVIAAIGDDFPGRIILHWYSGAIRDLEQGVSFGFYFSVNSAMLKAKKSRDLIQRVPLERILTETDGPFIKVGSNPATPLDIPGIVESLSSLWNKPLEITIATVADNFHTLLSGKEG
jgi:TatD DNase family protein